MDYICVVCSEPIKVGSVENDPRELAIQVLQMVTDDRPPQYTGEFAHLVCVARTAAWQ